MLCALCQELISKAKVSETHNILTIDLGNEIKHASYHSLARRRYLCSFCARIWGALPHEEPRRQRALQLLTKDDSDSANLKELPIKIWALWWKDLKEVWYLNVTILMPAKMYSFHFFEAKRDAADSIEIPMSTPTNDRPLDSREASYDNSLVDVKQWLASCDKEHPACVQKGQTEPWLPTRLVYVPKGDSRAYLCESRSLQTETKYMTLSYRWSTPDFKRLTTESLKAFQEGIPISELSLTFTQAIQVCKELGISYIWIDALCIIQDSRADWLAESIDMNLVYLNSVLNLAASASSSPSEGLFRSWNDKLDEECTFRHENGKWYSLTRNSDEDMLKEDFIHSPLHSRAWAIQELFLAPRTLHFTNLQIWWQCKSQVCVASSYCGSPQILNGGPLPRTYMVDSESSTLERWHNLARDYSACHLTYSEDKVIAQTGIANHFIALTLRSTQPDVYRAGLWKSAFHTDLLWYPIHGYHSCPMKSSDPYDTRTWETPEFSSLLGKRDPYVAPSWSWLSLHGPTTWGIPTTWNINWNYKNEDYTPCTTEQAYNEISNDSGIYAALTLDAPAYRIRLRDKVPYLPDLPHEPEAPIQYLFDGPESALAEGEYIFVPLISRTQASFIQRGIWVRAAGEVELADVRRKLKISKEAECFVRMGVWASEVIPYIRDKNGMTTADFSAEAQKPRVDILKLIHEKAMRRKVVIV